MKPSHYYLPFFRFPVRLLLLAALWLTITGTYAQTAVQSAEYTKLVASGDKYFASRDYGFALLDYGKALLIVPAQTYPKQKISQIRELFEKDPELQPSLFEDAILKGDSFLKNKDYPSSKRFFEAALELDPSSQYARDKIAVIRQFYNDPADASRYNDAMNKGTALLAAGQYDDAVNWFNIALAINPQAKPPRDKILEANRLKSENTSRKEQYARLIAGADKLLTAGQRNEAKEEYRKASLLMTQEIYPKQKIKEIDDYLNALQAQQDRYNKAIEQADQLYINRDFTKAALKYREALSVKPEARYPKEMLDKSEQGQSQLLTVKERYNATIASADQFFAAGDLNAALDTYKTALAILPEETYPRTKIQQLEILLQERSSRKEAYDIAVLNGNQAMEQDKPELALTHFKNALSLMPDEKYPSDKIQEINSMLAVRKKMDENYRSVIAKADQDFGNRNYDDAITGYRNALSIKASEQYPKDKIAEAEALIAAQKTNEENFGKAFQRGTDRFEAKEYMLALGSFNEALKYKPNDKTTLDRISQINRILADEKALQDQYSQAIARGNEALDAARYNDALSAFTAASGMKPSEKYPKDKIAEINKLLAEQAARKEAFDKAVSEADVFFAGKLYNEALGAYRKALEFLPEEQYPKTRIAEINTLLDGLKANDEAYAKLIAEADGQFKSKQYEVARVTYGKSLALKPAEKYPSAKIAEIDKILADTQASNNAFDKAVAEGDIHLASARYFEAIASYKEALAIKAGEKYPAQKIAEAEKAIADLKARQVLYDKSIAAGDKQMAAGNYEGALASFRTAGEAKPSETYPPQKIAEINKILDAVKTSNESYARAVSDGDAYFGAKKYREALEPYERASTIKPQETYPPKQIELINKLLADQKKLDDNYSTLISDADKAFRSGNYQAALKNYGDASTLKPEEQYPKDQIKVVEKALSDLKDKEEAYNKLISEGETFYKSKELNKALLSFRKSLEIKAEEEYPKEKIRTIEGELKAIDDKYRQAIDEGDRKLASKDYSLALNAFQQATEIKPGEAYPKERIAYINDALTREKEELDRMYTSYVKEGDQLLALQDYTGSRSAFTKASGIKPTEQYPKDKLQEISAILAEREKALKAEYDKAIADADKLYQQKILDQALDAYLKAAEIKPDEVYPVEMVRKIRQYISDHAIKDINTLTISIGAGEEKKFSFAVIEPRLRKNNYILINAKATGTQVPKVYLNYGRDNQKNGGIVIRSINNKELADYLIRLAGQDKWYREDNNWISIYTEGSGLEVNKVQIAAGDE